MSKRTWKNTGWWYRQSLEEMLERLYIHNYEELVYGEDCIIEHLVCINNEGCESNFDIGKHYKLVKPMTKREFLASFSQKTILVLDKNGEERSILAGKFFCVTKKEE